MANKVRFIKLTQNNLSDCSVYDGNCIIIDDSVDGGGNIYLGNLTESPKPLSSNILIRTVTSDSSGKIEIPQIDGYYFVNAVAYDNGYPLNVIRFGNYYYVGYYGGQEEPNTSTAVTLMFTSKAGYEVTIYYVKK